MVSPATEAPFNIFKVFLNSLCSASMQKFLPLSHRKAYYSAHNVYDRNMTLLDRLPKQEGYKLKKRLSALFKQLELQASMEEIMRGNVKLALNYFIKCLRKPKVLFVLLIKLSLKIISLLKLKFQTFSLNWYFNLCLILSDYFKIYKIKELINLRQG